MKKTLQVLAILCLVTMTSGCVTPYMVDRGRDAADILTVTVGIGGGAKVRAGPFQTGLLMNQDKLGLRGGKLLTADFKLDEFSHTYDTSDIDLLLFSLESFFMPQSFGRRDTRDKDYGSVGVGPLVYGVDYLHAMPWVNGFGDPGPVHFYTGIEAVIGLGPTLRFGVNPGEVVDFIIGWTTLDIFNDDLEWKKRKSNKGVEDISR